MGATLADSKSAAGRRGGTLARRADDGKVDGMGELPSDHGERQLGPARRRACTGTSSSVGAGVGRSLVRSPAMPVKAQRCRIVAEPAIRGLEDDLRQMLYGFARVHLATGCEDRRD